MNVREKTFKKHVSISNRVNLLAHRDSETFQNRIEFKKKLI